MRSVQRNQAVRQFPPAAWFYPSCESEPAHGAPAPTRLQTSDLLRATSFAGYTGSYSTARPRLPRLPFPAPTESGSAYSPECSGNALNFQASLALMPCWLLLSSHAGPICKPYQRTHVSRNRSIRPLSEINGTTTYFRHTCAFP